MWSAVSNLRWVVRNILKVGVAAMLAVLAPIVVEARGPLDGVALVLDPGHGDQGSSQVPPDYGATVDTADGRACEGVYT